MGFFSTHGASRKDIIEEIARDQHDTKNGRIHKTIAHAVVLNTVWAVHQIVDLNGNVPERYIACYRLGKRPEGWGYRPDDEGVGPTEYSCPLRFLDMAPEANAEWRQKVREYHAAKAAARAKALSVAVGQKWTLVGARGLTYVQIGRVKPLAGTCDDGRFYRIPAKMLGVLIA